MTLISRKYIDDNDVVARYLADRLSKNERESFERYYLENPEILRELDRTAQFKSALIDMRNSGTLGKAAPHKPSWRVPIAAATAASLLVVIASTTWVILHAEPRPILAKSVADLTNRFQSTLPLAGAYSIHRTRTSSYDATVKLPLNTGAIELRIKPEVPAVPALYKVSLKTVTVGSSIASAIELGHLQATKDGFVVVYVNSSDLSPAVYEIRISGEVDTNSANTVSSFLVELISDSVR